METLVFLVQSQMLVLVCCCSDSARILESRDFVNQAHHQSRATDVVTIVLVLRVALQFLLEFLKPTSRSLLMAVLAGIEDALL